ncbi:Protein kinase of the Mitotic Exit Network [Orobanche gracilis]
MGTRIKVFKGKGDVVNEENNRRVFLGTCVYTCLVKEVEQNFWESNHYLRGGSVNTEEAVMQRLERQTEFNHENVLKIRGYAKDDQANPPVLLVAMERLEYNLVQFVRLFEDQLTDKFNHPTDLARKIVRGIVDGVHYLHEQGVRCPHIRPSNILVTAEGVVKVDPSTDTSHPDTLWTAPEENNQSDAINDNVSLTWWKQSDMYRLASIIFYVITGGKRHILGAEVGDVIRYIDSLKSRDYPTNLQSRLAIVSRECASLLGPLLTQNHTLRFSSVNVSEPFFWNYMDAARFIVLISNMAEDNYITIGTRKLTLKQVIDGIAPPWNPQSTWKGVVNPKLSRDMVKDTREWIKRKYDRQEISKEEKDAELQKLKSSPNTVFSFIRFFRNIYSHEDKLQRDTIQTLQSSYGGTDYIWRHMLHCYDGLVTDLRDVMVDVGESTWWIHMTDDQNSSTEETTF